MNAINKALVHAIKNTKQKCTGSHNGIHRPIQKMGSITGYICRSCNKEIENLCQVCRKPKSECKDFNDYYIACEECL